MTEPSRWVVDKIVLNGRHGRYAVVQDRRLGLVTFSLESDVWPEKRLPEEGSEVVLEDFQKKRAGWRAMSARFLRPEDIVNKQQAPQARSKEQ